jgi:PAS domain S-box-containing protein
VYATVIPFLDANKKPFQYLAIRFDITEKKISDEAIRISNERYNLVAKATNDAIWDWNLETNQVVRAGEGLEKLFGYDPAEADKYDNFWNERTHPDDFERWQQKLKDVASDPLANYWEDEYRFRKADGAYAIVYEKGYIIRNPSGKAIRIIGATQDITKLRENENRLNELNEHLQQNAKELADSNAELEQFAYVASHDLQEPLRMVTGFLTQLERKYSANIDDTGKKYINFAVDGAKRMRHIILDLLEFSRVGRKEGNMENLDLNYLITEIKILFQKQIEEKKATISVEELPAIYAYKTPIRQVFQNLIGNALKYSKPGIPVKIHISVTELTDQWQFSVSDNGIGINEEYFDKIFVIFQRLHNKDEFSGTGIGLAVTKKVIENHGGKIWVTSEEGKGSTFYFTIKKG